MREFDEKFFHKGSISIVNVATGKRKYAPLNNRMFTPNRVKSFISSRITSAYEAGQDSAIYAMDLQAQQHWMEEGMKKEREELLKLVEKLEDGVFGKGDLITHLNKPL